MAGSITVLTPANAATSSVGLGTAKPFAILVGSTVTNTGPTVINGQLGLSPGTAVTGFPPGVSGPQHIADAVALQAKNDLVTAYNDAANRPATEQVATELGGRTFLDGVYRNGTGLGITGTVTLDGQNAPSSVWIFQAGSTLITATSSRVALINGANPCNVFWQVGSSATLGVNTTFVGTIMALESISVKTGTAVTGRALARNAAVTLNDTTPARHRPKRASRLAPLAVPVVPQVPVVQVAGSVPVAGATAGTDPVLAATAVGTNSPTPAARFRSCHWPESAPVCC